MARKNKPIIDRTKRVWSLTSFHRGIDNKNSQTSLAESSLLKCEGAKVDSFGKIKVAGHWEEIDDIGIPEDHRGQQYPASGLYYFRSDYNVLTYNTSEQKWVLAQNDAELLETPADILLIQSGQKLHIRQQIGSDIAYAYNIVDITSAGDSYNGYDQEPASLSAVSKFESFFKGKSLRICDANFLNDVDGHLLSKGLIFYNNTLFPGDAILAKGQTSRSLAIMGGTGNQGNANPMRFIDRLQKPYYQESGGGPQGNRESMYDAIVSANRGKPGVSSHLPQSLDAHIGHSWGGVMFPSSLYTDSLAQGGRWSNLVSNEFGPRGGLANNSKDNAYHFGDFGGWASHTDNDRRVLDGNGSYQSFFSYFEEQYLQLNNPGDFDSGHTFASETPYNGNTVKYSYDPDANNWLAINDWAPYKQAYMAAKDGIRRYSSPIRFHIQPSTSVMMGSNSWGKNAYTGGSQWNPCWLIAPIYHGDTPSYGKISIFFDILGIYDPNGPFWDPQDFGNLGMQAPKSLFSNQGASYLASSPASGVSFCLTKLSKGDIVGYDGIHTNNYSEFSWNNHGNVGINDGYSSPPWEGIKTLTDMMIQANPEFRYNSGTNSSEANEAGQYKTYGEFPWRNCHWGTVDSLGKYDALALGIFTGTNINQPLNYNLGAIDMANFRFEYTPFGTDLPFFPLGLKLTLIRGLLPHNPNDTEMNTITQQQLYINRSHEYESSLEPFYNDEFGSMQLQDLINQWANQNPDIENMKFYNNRWAPTFVRYEMTTDAYITSLGFALSESNSNLTFCNLSSISGSNNDYKKGLTTWNGINDIGLPDFQDAPAYNNLGFIEEDLKIQIGLNQGQLSPYTDNNVLNFYNQTASINQDIDWGAYYGADNVDMGFEVEYDFGVHSEVGEIDIKFTHNYLAETSDGVDSNVENVDALVDTNIVMVQTLSDNGIITPDEPIEITSLFYQGTLESWNFSENLVINQYINYENGAKLYLNTSQQANDISPLEVVEIANNILDDPFITSDFNTIESSLVHCTVKMYPDYTTPDGVILNANDLLSQARNGIFYPDGPNLKTLNDGYNYKGIFSGYIYVVERNVDGSTSSDLLSIELIGDSSYSIFSQVTTANWKTNININLENSDKYQLVGLYGLKPVSGSEFIDAPFSQLGANFINFLSMYSNIAFNGKENKHIIKRAFWQDTANDYFLKQYINGWIDYFKANYSQDTPNNSVPAFLTEDKRFLMENLLNLFGADGFNESDVILNNTWISLPESLNDLDKNLLFIPIIEGKLHDSGANLDEALTDSETGVDVTDGTKFIVGDTILIDDEFMEVTAISSNTLTVVRQAYDEKTRTRLPSSSHVSGADIYISPKSDKFVCGLVSPYYDENQLKTNLQNSGLPNIEDHPVFIESNSDLRDYYINIFNSIDPALYPYLLESWGVN